MSRKSSAVICPEPLANKGEMDVCAVGLKKAKNAENGDFSRPEATKKKRERRHELKILRKLFHDEEREREKPFNTNLAK